MRSAEEIIEEIKVSSLTAEELGLIMSAATTKLMANAFVEGGLDMMSDPSIWGRAMSGSATTGVMSERYSEPCGSRGTGLNRGRVCVRDSGHGPADSLFGHRDSEGNLW